MMRLVPKAGLKFIVRKKTSFTPQSSSSGCSTSHSRLLQNESKSRGRGRLILLSASVLVGGLLVSACQPESVRQEKRLRRQLVHEIRNHSYAAAAPIARQLLQRKPRDERLWKQLVQAQLGLQDLEGAKQSLQRWRNAIPSTSVRADEFEGDIAREEHNYQTALSTWNKVGQSQPNNHRVRQKLASLQQTLEHWTEAESVWGSVLALKEIPTAHLNRAICRRRLHKWNEAFDDFERARKLAPDDPEVRHWSKVFDGLQKYKEQLAEIDAKVAMLPEEFGLLGDRALLFLR